MLEVIFGLKGRSSLTKKVKQPGQENDGAQTSN